VLLGKKSCSEKKNKTGEGNQKEVPECWARGVTIRLLNIGGVRESRSTKAPINQRRRKRRKGRKLYQLLKLSVNVRFPTTPPTWANCLPNLRGVYENLLVCPPQERESTGIHNFGGKSTGPTPTGHGPKKGALQSSVVVASGYSRGV